MCLAHHISVTCPQISNCAAVKKHNARICRNFRKIVIYGVKKDMDKEKRKALKEAYANRRPDMGIVCWKSGDSMWIAKSKDVKADFNGTSFQLKLGSWPNREMQSAYNSDPDSFEWVLLKKLDYEEPDENHDDDLELLYLEFADKYPAAKPMKRGKR